MRVDSSAPGAPKGKLWDLDTGRRIPKPLWFDTDPQLPNVPPGHWTFEAYQVFRDAQGKERVKQDGQGDYLTWFGSGRLAFIPADPKPTPSWAGPDEPLRFEGRAKERLEAVERGDQPPGPNGKARKVSLLPAILLDCPCEGKCGRLATHQVADEVEQNPQLWRGKLWSRGRMVDVHYFCAWCYKPPRVLDHKGEEVREYEDAYRPQ